MIRRATAAAGLLLVIGGVPLVLLEYAGAPGLDGLPDLEGLRRAIELRWLPTEWVMQILALFAWGLWAYLAFAVALRVAGSLEARLRGDGRLWAASEAVTWSPVKLVVDLALGAVLLSSTLSHEAARAKSSVERGGWGPAVAGHMAVIREDSSHLLGAAAPPRTVTERAKKEPTGQTHSEDRSPQKNKKTDYVVRPGDSLWSVAESRLQDPYRWPEIWRLNKDRVMPDGERLSRPGFLRPGWTLDLPRVHVTDGHKEKRKKAGHVADCETEAKKFDASATTQGSPTARSDGPEAPSESPPSSPPAPDSDVVDPSRRIELPDGTAVTAAFVAGLVSGLAAARLRRRRRRRPGELSSEPVGESDARKLGARLIRQGLGPAQGPNEERTLEPERVDLFVKRARDDDPPGIVLGHRRDEAVIAWPSNILYSFGGGPDEVASLFSDLAAHALVSHRRGLEIWTIRGLDLPSADAVRVFDDASALLMELELEVIRRRRLLHEEAVTEWDQHRVEVPDDPLPLMVALFTYSVDEADRDRLLTVVRHGAALGVMVLAHDPGENSVEVEDSVLLPRGALKDLLGEGPIAPVHVSEQDRQQLSAVLEVESRASDQPETRPDVIRLDPTPTAAADSGACVQLQLLGPPRVVVAGKEVDPDSGFGPKTRELLFYFVLRPEGASRDVAIEALWPESEPEAGAKRFWATIGKVRSNLRNHQAPAAMFVKRSGETYKIEPEYFDVDVWEFDRLLNEDQDDASAKQPLAKAVEMYREDLLEGTYCEWVEPLRERLRSRFLDALVRLAEEHSKGGDDKEALAAFLQAISRDPFSEPLYRRAILLAGRLGDKSQVERLYNKLVEVLADELSVEPEEETLEAKNQALRGQDVLRNEVAVAPAE